MNRDQEGKFARKVTAETDPGLGGQTATALDLAPTDLPVSAMADLARALDAKEEEWEELAAASPDDDFLQAKAKFHTEVLDDIRSQIQDHVNLPYEATSDEELFIALTEQADAAYAEEGMTPRRGTAAMRRCCRRAFRSGWKPGDACRGRS